MDIERMIGLLKQKRNEAAFIASLNPNNNEYIPWRRNIEDILETAFSVNSTEYNRVRALRISNSKRSSLQIRYKKLIRRIQLEVNSIIQKYEMLDLEMSSQDKSKDNNSITSLDVLFDAMQFHNEIIMASKSLFESKHYAEAIFEAFKAVENFVRETTGLSLYGKQLMASAFNEDNPLIQVTEAGKINRDVQEGFKFLFMGAMGGIRNPKAHYRIIQRDPYITLEYLGFASFLLKRIEGWQVNQGKEGKLKTI
ncbi:TIGR02391 family protein [Chloroflexota bacterium]